MKVSLPASLLMLCVCAFQPVPASGAPLKVLTINVWSGLDYFGTLRMREYENAEVREARFRSLVAQTEDLAPDVIFVQEANPVRRYAAKLASALSMKEIHQVVNGGIKVGPFGIPANLKEGLVILAKPELSLRKTAAWKLSGPPGLHTDVLSFHLGEVVLALAGIISQEGQDVCLVNVHLTASPRKPEDMAAFREGVLLWAEMDEDGFKEAVLHWDRREVRRGKELARLLDHLKELPPELPCIVAGDFNAEPDSVEIKIFRSQGGFNDLPEQGIIEGMHGHGSFTWDMELNKNTAFSTSSARSTTGKVRQGYDYLSALAGARNRRLDHIFLRNGSSRKKLLTSGVVLTEEVGGIQPSDHFGVLAEIDLK